MYMTWEKWTHANQRFGDWTVDADRRFCRVYFMERDLLFCFVFFDKVPLINVANASIFFRPLPPNFIWSFIADVVSTINDW